MAKADARSDSSEHLPTRLVALLERAIISGELKGGERLEEVSLATRYGVSRTPVREALRVLASHDLVEIRPRRSAIVRTVTSADLAEMFEAMAELEAGCARLAARRAGAGDLARLEEAQFACSQAADADDAAGYADANERFHLGLYMASRNRYLVEDAQRFYRRLEPYRRLLFEFPERRATSFREHAGILEALNMHDEAAADARVRKHVSILGERFAILVTSLGEPRSRND